MKILSIFGTRPEAIKMAPLVQRLESDPAFVSHVCITAQHRSMLDSVLKLFDISASFDLNIMKENQNLTQVTTAVLEGLMPILRNLRPDRVLVHGDTTTTFAGALAAFYAKIPVGHVEAGLRTGDLQAPWPEELNRRLTDQMSDMHFAPTKTAQKNLLANGIGKNSIFITGNTVIDALLAISDRLEASDALEAQANLNLPKINEQCKLILVTGHRRENFGEGFENICAALARLADRPDVNIVYPVHLNPNVQGPVKRLLGNRPNIHLTDPLDYLSFVYLMKRAHLIISDSGGIQEEAPALGKPVLVLRDKTERPEAVEAGTVKLVGTNSDMIVHETEALLDNKRIYENMSQAHNPYGDGRACERIVAELKHHV